MLHGKLTLLGIDDVDGFCASIVGHSGLKLSRDEHEDLHAFLIACCWELSLGFQPGRLSFSTYAGTTLRRRAIDWNRSRRGRTRWVFRDPNTATGYRVHERPPREFVSFDADEDVRTRLESDLGTRTGDSEADRDPAFDGLLEAGDRPRARDLERLGLGSARRAAG